MQHFFVKHGLMLGLVSILVTYILYFYDVKILLLAGSWIGMAIAVYFIVKVVSVTKAENGGFISLNEAFKAGWLTFVLGSFISSVFMFILVNYVDTALIDHIRNMQIDALMQTKDFLKLSESQLNDQISTIQNTNPYGLAQIAIEIPVSFLFPGAVLAIIIAAIMKRNRPEKTMT